jgi:azurin
MLGRGDVGRSGAHSLQVALKGDGASGGANTRVKVKPGFRYEVSGWIKTDGLPPGPNGTGGRGGGGGGRGFGNLSGATLFVQQGGGRGGGGGFPTFIRGTSDWTQVKSQFNANNDEVTLLASASLGATGTGGGSAWFDDVTVRELGPVDESSTDPLSGVINHLTARAAANAPAAVVEAAPSNAVTLNLGVIPDVMKYDKTELTVKAGVPVKLVFRNNDHMQHNFLLLRPGSIEKVGALADQMMTDTTAAAKNYVPLSPDILANTPLVDPEKTVVLDFTAPAQPGRYPFVCTFPGHWRLMQGTLVVTP